MAVGGGGIKWKQDIFAVGLTAHARDWIATSHANWVIVELPPVTVKLQSRCAGSDYVVGSLCDIPPRWVCGSYGPTHQGLFPRSHDVAVLSTGKENVGQA